MTIINNYCGESSPSARIIENRPKAATLSHPLSSSSLYKLPQQTKHISLTRSNCRLLIRSGLILLHFCVEQKSIFPRHRHFPLANWGRVFLLLPFSLIFFRWFLRCSVRYKNDIAAPNCVTESEKLKLFFLSLFLQTLPKNKH